MAAYTDYQPEPDDNTAAPPVGAPEGNYPGKVVNNTFRRLMAAVRNLGDSVPKLETGGDPTARVGTMAYQNASAVAITGGTIGGAVSGVTPVRGIISYGGTLAQAETLAPNWGICDGRTVNGIATPNLRGRFIRGWSDDLTPGDTGGSTDDLTTSSGGSHDHGAVTGSTALTVAQMPAHTHAITGVETSGNNTGSDPASTSGSASDDLETESKGGGEGHTHSITSGGAHTHTVTSPPPPYYALIYLMRTA